MNFFGRSWSITINTQSGQQLILTSEQSAEPLHVTFTAESYLLMEYWKAEVKVFNLTSAVQSQLLAGSVPVNNLWQLNQPLQTGDSISISAGYKNGSKAFDPASNLIYEGNIFQPLWTRVNVVDSVVTLRCLVGLLQSTFNHSSASVAKNSCSLDVVNQICTQAGIPVEHIDDLAQQALSDKRFPRGQVIHDRPVPALRGVLKDNNLLGFISPRGLNVRSMDSYKNATPDFTYGPPVQLNTGLSNTASSADQVTRTLIGVPEQTQDGIIFRVLMDSRPRIGDVVQIAPGTAINGLPVNVGDRPPGPNQDMIYVVAGLRHNGDSRGRGNDWYTEIIGVTANFFPAFLASRNAAN